MKPATVFIATVVIAVIAASVTVHVMAPTQSTAQVAETKTETLFEKINRTGTIRCGYVAYAPYLIKDANTGKMSGIFYDLTEKMAQLLNLKVEWAHETSFANYIEDMKTGRYDVYCGGLWPEANRSRFVQYTRPVNYVGMGIYVRSDDSRFDNSIEKLNDAAYRFATMDGEMSDFVAKEDFPNAQLDSHPHNAAPSELLLDVATKKADAVAIERAAAEEFAKTNPGVLKNLSEAKPIRLFGNTWAVLRGNSDVVSMFDTVLDEMVNTGYVDKTVGRYDLGMTNFYPLALPFQAPQKH